MVGIEILDIDISKIRGDSNKKKLYLIIKKIKRNTGHLIKRTECVL